MMERAEAERHLDNLYGLPGENNETDRSMAFLEAMLREMGLSALTDEAVVRLAQMQVDYENTPRY